MPTVEQALPLVMQNVHSEIVKAKGRKKERLMNLKLNVVTSG